MTVESGPFVQSAGELNTLVVGVFVWGLMFWCVIRYRKRGASDELPVQTRFNLPIEVLYTVVPFLIIAALFFYTVIVQNKVMERSDNPDETIAVNAFKWNWRFVYPDTQGPDGEPVGETLRWGLVPSWAKDLKSGPPLINVRADTVATKSSFPSAFKRRRSSRPSSTIPTSSPISRTNFCPLSATRG